MELKLPDSIGGKRDLILATRQVEKVLNDRLQDEVRERFGAKKVGTKAGQRMLEELLEVNKLKDDTKTLKMLVEHMSNLKQHAPQIRVAYAQEPDQDIYRRTVSWFRKEIHPGVLVQIGVQPTIGAGFVLQTPMRRYDFTLRTKILSSSSKFIEILHRAHMPAIPDKQVGSSDVPEAVPATPSPQPVQADPTPQEEVVVKEQSP